MLCSKTAKNNVKHACTNNDSKAKYVNNIPGPDLLTMFVGNNISFGENELMWHFQMAWSVDKY